MSEKPKYIVGIKFPEADDVVGFTVGGRRPAFSVVDSKEGEWLMFSSVGETLPTYSDLQNVYYTFNNKFIIFEYSEYEKWCEDNDYIMVSIPEEEMEKLIVREESDG